MDQVEQVKQSSANADDERVGNYHIQPVKELPEWQDLHRWRQSILETFLQKIV